MRPEICRSLLKCGHCDFSSKVRRNLLRHLRRHKKQIELVESGEISEAKEIAVIAPVNPPTVHTNTTTDSSYSRMKSLLAGDVEDDMNRQPISDEELEAMPRNVPENVRYACGVKDCRYITIDDVMLQHHIQACHADCEQYTCPHCTDVNIPLAEISFHLRCHGELLFKCGFCYFYHWQKRTAEKHATEQHPNKKLFVRNVREDEEFRNNKKKRKKEVVLPKSEAPLVVSYQPFKCGICDISTHTLEEVLEHIKIGHEITQQYKCAFCTFTSDAKVDVDAHYSKVHPHYLATVLKMYFVDPSTCTQENDSVNRKPLWSRDMEGYKHIRGILFEEEVADLPKPSPRKPKKEKFELSPDKIKKEVKTEVGASPTKSAALTPGGGKGQKSGLDFYPMQCRQCQVHIVAPLHIGGGGIFSHVL